MSVRIGIGLARFPFEDARGFGRWLAQCEASELDSVWQTDRLVSSEPFLESMAAMAYVAGATRRLRFGMNAVVVPFRDPVVLAKQCATIDHLSGGRLLPVFGVGADHAPEWRSSGSGGPQRRGTRANEALMLMQRLWTEERVSFEGRFYRLHDVSVTPRPVQHPLPCWIGGNSPAAVRRTALLGTGWLAGAQPAAEVARVIAEIKTELERTGRAIDPDHYGASLPFRFGSWDPELERQAALRARRAGQPGTARELFAVGDAGDIVSRLRAYHAAGASKYVLLPLARGESDLAEQTRLLVQEVLPEVHALPDPAGPPPIAEPPPKALPLDSELSP